MSLRKFDPSEILLTDQEAWQVLVFFFGGNASTMPSRLTDNDKSFAQALLLEAVDASDKISWIQTLWQASINPNSGVKSILKKLAKKALREWLESLKPEDLADAKIYIMVKNQLTLNWRSPWRIRIESGEPVY